MPLVLEVKVSGEKFDLVEFWLQNLARASVIAIGNNGLNMHRMVVVVLSENSGTLLFYFLYFLPLTQSFSVHYQTSYTARDHNGN